MYVGYSYMKAVLDILTKGSDFEIANYNYKKYIITVMFKYYTVEALINAHLGNSKKWS